jgi:hypothetical protein
MKFRGAMLGGSTVPACSRLNTGVRSTGVLAFRTVEKSAWQEHMTAAHRRLAGRRALIS